MESELISFKKAAILSFTILEVSNYNKFIHNDSAFFSPFSSDAKTKLPKERQRKEAKSAFFIISDLILHKSNGKKEGYLI